MEQDVTAKTLIRTGTDSQVEYGSATSMTEWSNMMASRLVPVQLSAPKDEGFHGTVRSRSIDEAEVSEIRANRHIVLRRACDIRRDQQRHFKLSLQLEGTGTVSQDGRTARLMSGDLAIYDTSRPYRLEYDGDMCSLVMIVPHGAFGVPARTMEHLTARTLSGGSGIGRIVSPFLQQLAENIDELSGSNGTRIMRSALDLITALIAAEHSQDAEVSTRALTLEEACEYIEQNLSDPELSGPRIAEAHHVSLRYLQFLFQEQNQTVSGYIRVRRLRRCWADLLSPGRENESVMQIARRWGFHDPSHFSRTFKSEYGLSPRQFRLAHARVSA